MADVIVAIIQFPNDPTNNSAAHQMFVAEQTGATLNLYSISSIPGKERRVYGPDKDCYVTIVGAEYIANGFKVPSFIDCTKMYQVSISSSCNIAALSQRNISQDLRERIEEKVSQMKTEGRHTIYSISEMDFCRWNPKI